MSTPVYFCWQDDVRVVYGASRAAVYDFRTGNVYSLNESARSIIESIESSQSMNTQNLENIALLKQLVELKLAYLSQVPREPLNDKIESPPSTPLNFLWLELTDTCNLQCVHCYADAGPQHKRQRMSDRSSFDAGEFVLHQRSTQHQLPLSPAQRSMSEEDWIKVIQDAAQLGCRQLQLIGGEPLLYRSLLQLIDAALDAKYSFIEIFTNGTLLTDSMTQALADRGVHIAVSLHSTDPETQDQIAQQKGTYQKVYKGLLLLKKYKIPTRLATTILSENQDALDDLQRLADALDISDVSHDIIRPVGRGATDALRPENPDLLRSKWLYEPDFVTCHESYHRNKWWNSCWAGKIAVKSDGSVIPCVFGRDHVVGNVLNDTIRNVLNGEHLRKLWGLTKDQVDICRDCEYRYACDDCRPLALGETGDLYAKYPRCTYDPYLGKWESITGIQGKNDSSLIRELTANLNATGTLTVQEISQTQLNYQFKDSRYTLSEITLANNGKVSMLEKCQRCRCNPKNNTCDV